MPADSAGFEVHPAPMAVAPRVVAVTEGRLVPSLDRHHLLLGDEVGCAQRVSRVPPGYLGLWKGQRVATLELLPEGHPAVVAV